ncbi:MAG: hypothetical protein JWO83_3208 [Caulobacteraceae bacterium]|jgi:hypothetical protein|nr:hypothetical protein [Caulobacteraceae bacterium]
MDQTELQGRHHDRYGEINRKHGNIRVRPLRRLYGPDFARGFPNDEKLKDVLPTLDEASLGQLVHDYERGYLAGKIASAHP